MKRKIIGMLLCAVTVSLLIMQCMIPAFAESTENVNYNTAQTVFLHGNGSITDDTIENLLGYYYYYGVGNESGSKIDYANKMQVDSGYYYVYGTDSAGKWGGAKKKLVYVRRYGNFKVRIEGCDDGALLFDGAELKDGTYRIYDDRTYMICPLEIDGFEAVMEGAVPGEISSREDMTVTVKYKKTDKIALNGKTVKRTELKREKASLEKYISDLVYPLENRADYDTAKVYYLSFSDENGLNIWDEIDYVPADGSKMHAFGENDIETLKIVYSDSTGKLSDVSGTGNIGLDYLPSNIVCTQNNIPNEYYKSDFTIGEKEIFNIVYDREKSVPSSLEYDGKLFEITYLDSITGEWVKASENPQGLNSCWHRIASKNGIIHFRLKFLGNDEYLPDAEKDIMLALIHYEAPIFGGISSIFGGGRIWLIMSLIVITVAVIVILVIVKKKKTKQEIQEIKKSEDGKENADENK